MCKERKQRIINRFLFVSAVLFFVFLSIGLWGTFALESIQLIDEHISLGFFSLRQPFLTDLAIFLTSFFDFWGQIVITLTLMLVFYRWLRDWKVPLWYGSGVLMVALFLNSFAKRVFERPRPDGSYHLIEQGGLSFPSGHSMGAIIIIGLAIFLCYYYGSQKLKKWTTILGGLLIVAVGMTRIYLGVHYFSDIIGGFALAGASLSAWAAVFIYWQE